MLVVADTTPIRYLTVVGHLELLPALFGEIVIPDVVLAELTHPSSPASVRHALQATPAWLEVRASATPLPDALVTLDPGERAALALALQLSADLVLVDDGAARRAATALGVRITGTIGVLALAADKGLIDVRDTLTKLRDAGFYVDTRVISAVFAKWL